MRPVNERIDALRQEISAMGIAIHENPELGFEERLAVRLQKELLEKYGFTVETGTAGLETAYTAVYRSGRPGPVLGYLAEYDALPEMGHACGHNLICCVACTAGIALRDAVDEYGGEVWVIGAPAEETSGGKVDLGKAGIYSKLDAALMAHPLGRFAGSGNMFAIDPLQFEFFGQEAHAAAEPEKGINALDAAIQTFNNINALRQHLRDDVRIHGIIANGGAAPNIVPGYACARFYVRSASTAYLKEVSEKVKRCAQAGADAAGATLKITNFENGYDNLMSNRLLSDRAIEHLRALGVEGEIPTEDTKGSSDIGDVSQYCPTIHMWFDVTGDPNIGTHTKEFAVCTGSEYALKNTFLQAAALTLTGEDLLKDPSFLAAVKKEFTENLGKK